MSANQPYRSCGKCGQYTVPFGVDWSHWENGKPIGLECIDQPEPSLRDAIFHELNCFEVDASEINDGVTYIDSGEAETLTDSLMTHIQTHEETAVREARISERKLFAKALYKLGVNLHTSAKILAELPELSHPQAGEGEGK